MSDDYSFAEKLSVEANIAVIKIDLTEMNVADGRDREPGWHYRAQRALAYMKARLAACVAEVEARRKQQRPQAHHKLLGEHTQQRNLKTAQLDRTDAERFKMAAKAMLPRHTWLAIWAAVEADKAAASTPPESPTEATIRPQLNHERCRRDDAINHPSKSSNRF